MENAPSSAPRRVLLTGATGFIGGQLMRALLARGHRVRACVRDPARARLPPGVEAVDADFTRDHRPEDWAPRLAGVDAVVNAVGIIREQGSQRFAALHRDAPAALFTACARAGVKRVVQISALGADQGATSHYHLTKRAADDLLASLDLDWLVLRPSIVFGRGAKSEAFFRALAALPLTPLVAGGGQPIRPVAVEDLVQVAVTAIEEGRPLRTRVDLVGAEEVSFRDYLASRRSWLGLGPLRGLSLPYRLALRLARVGGFLGSQSLDPGAIAMLARGNSAPLEPTERAIGFRPGGFRAWLAAHGALEADRWHARLFFLPALVRWSVALTWISAGVTSALLWPVEESYRMLAAVGVSGALAPAALYGAALIDLLLGLATLARRRLGLVVAAQLAVMAGYTVIITAFLPEWWLHPFGPVVKNLPLAAAALVMLALEAPRR